MLLRYVVHVASNILLEIMLLAKCCLVCAQLYLTVQDSMEIATPIPPPVSKYPHYATNLALLKFVLM